MLDQLDSWIHAVGPYTYLALFGAALIEYVFPPFPGDSVVLLGGVYAVRGEKPWWLVLLVVTLGSVVGAAIDYYVGVRISRAFEERGAFAEKHPNLARMEERMRRSGMWLIAFNRFMPGVRGVLFLAAGASGMNPARVFGWGAFSALLWNGLILAVGITLGGNAERLESLLRHYNVVAWAVLGVVACVLLVRQGLKWIRGRRRVQEQRDA